MGLKAFKGSTYMKSTMEKCFHKEEEKDSSTKILPPVMNITKIWQLNCTGSPGTVPWTLTTTMQTTSFMNTREFSAPGLRGGGSGSKFQGPPLPCEQWRPC